MTYNSQHTPPWRAFVPTPKKAEEWMREMDGVIASAVGELSELKYVAPGIYGYSVPSYSSDLEAVVRAAEKWCAMASPSSEERRWNVGNSLCPKGVFWAIVSAAPRGAEASSPALALAKALHAAIKAEERGKPETLVEASIRHKKGHDAADLQAEAYKNQRQAALYAAEYQCPNCGRRGCECALNLQMSGKQ